MAKKCYCGFEGYKWQPPFWWIHNRACKHHDEAYDQGGSWIKKLRTDFVFFSEMVANGIINFLEAFLLILRGIFAILTAPFYFLAVMMFGWKTWNMKK